jgi:hypothetical protein
MRNRGCVGEQRGRGAGEGQQRRAAAQGFTVVSEREREREREREMLCVFGRGSDGLTVHIVFYLPRNESDFISRK